jgi:hypothetical protein
MAGQLQARARSTCGGELIHFRPSEIDVVASDPPTSPLPTAMACSSSILKSKAKRWRHRKGVYGKRGRERHSGRYDRA